MCAGLQLVGSWLRYLGSMRNTFWAMFLGQAFFGVAVSAIDSSPTYIANTWFRTIVILIDTCITYKLHLN